MILCNLPPSKTPYFKQTNFDGKLSMWLLGNSYNMPVTSNYTLTGNELNYTITTVNNPTITLPDIIPQGYGVYIQAVSGYFNLAVGECVVAAKTDVSSISTGWTAAKVVHIAKGVWEVWGNTLGSTLTSGLVAYYNFQNTNWADLADNGYTLTGVNDPSNITGIQGNGVLTRDDFGAYLYSDKNWAYDGGPFTISFWLQAKQMGNYFVGVGRVQDPPYIRFGYVNAGNVVFDIADVLGGVTTLQTDNPQISVNNWYHLAVSYTDPTTATLYLNVSDAGSLTTTTFDGSGFSKEFYINGWAAKNTPLVPNVVATWQDEFSVYSRALSQTDITYLYNSGNGRTYVNGTVV